ncbi:Radical SAM domain-containing protein [Neobacillus bataviensis LMG 21833]|uniref:Radical SAM domain-containing protein n=1 Tax=Neobacillus bataviensis LMG 21833 TaxID=1117379 RepID=K6DWW9_9BACI|nr:anaerobic sulfatase maturase [Neobacillus bataviensis]EKN65351.1 Radical SAM domain-containing protein [Neobacillus bataviensis LMG 21833]
MTNSIEQTKGYHILAKPSGPICNLDCHYCFYTEKEALFTGNSRFRMTDEALEEFIRQYITTQNAPDIPFVWQGGEPTLMGLDFYKRVIELQKKYGKGKQISNSLQTNGTLLNEEWCQFLAKNNFLVGLSLDGPEYIHDRYRVDRGGKPTFKKVVNALRLLKKYKVAFNVLACVTKDSSNYPLEIYHFFKEEGVEFIQFIPIVERMPDIEAKKLGLRHATPLSINRQESQQAVSSWTVEAEKYGEFLIAIFEEWVRKDVGKVHVMNFEHALTAWLGLPATSCFFAETCGRAAIVEHNGDVYSCDHFMYPDYKLGNIFNDTFTEMIESSRQRAFGENKKSSLPSYCQTCEVRFACNGECPKHRFLLTPDGEPGLNYLCAGYKKYFHHIHRYLKVMVQLIENGLPATEIMEVIKRPLILKK